MTRLLSSASEEAEEAEAGGAGWEMSAAHALGDVGDLLCAELVDELLQALDGDGGHVAAAVVEQSQHECRGRALGGRSSSWPLLCLSCSMRSCMAMKRSSAS